MNRGEKVKKETPVLPMIEKINHSNKANPLDNSLDVFLQSPHRDDKNENRHQQK